MMKIFAIHAKKKTHQEMTRIQKMGTKLSSGCDVVNVRDAISSIVWMRHNPVNYVMIENIVAIRNHGSCPENSVYIQYLPVFTVFTYSIYSIYLIFTYRNFSDQPWQI